jgi:hypothetical protein
MKHDIYRRVLLAPVLALALMCATATAAYANTGEAAGTEDAAPPAITEPEPTPEPEPADPVELTPEGQMTLVDDLSGEQAVDKQFLTIITKNGNYFYLVIDRSGDTENVHFLNLVDESDLLALIEGEVTTAQATTTPEPVEQAPVAPEPEPVPEPESEPGIDLSLILGAMVLAALTGGGILFYLKVLKPKRTTRSAAVPTELDGFDFTDDEPDDIDVGGIDIMEPDEQTQPHSYEDWEERKDRR